MASRVDANGVFIENVLLGEGQELPAGCVEPRPPAGLHALKSTGGAWVEGKPEAEILEGMKAAKVEEMEATGVEELAAHIPHGRDENLATIGAYVAEHGIPPSGFLRRLSWRVRGGG